MQALIKFLRHKEAHVGLRSARSLGELGPAAEKAVGFLKQRSRDKDEKVQKAAKKAIDKIRG